MRLSKMPTIKKSLMLNLLQNRSNKPERPSEQLLLNPLPSKPLIKLYPSNSSTLHSGLNRIIQISGEQLTGRFRK